MAKFIKTYEINLGDYIRFKTISGEKMCGTVQCISEFPDVFVETGNPQLNDYKRYRISINLIEEVLSNKSGEFQPFWKCDEVKFNDGEDLEFVYDDNFNRVITNRYK